MTDTTSEMVESVEQILQDKEKSKAVVRQLLKDFGGMQIYLPLPGSAFREEDEKELYDAYTGDNQRELCRRFGISFNTFYNILRREKNRRVEEYTKKTQKELNF